ncbi:SIMPL domain-containing protein [Caldicellulosiruptor naganoensis]|uniref:SIMPL domain-containing protein n=1 Tax=Caldicellulosiruptor naganoensis TaxID=29324 RepID=A0ABY7BD87_9FIRM|nr:SIMPL domain-containing protein [Caldicellulosiruptor naganoensis]WAM30799.1 SIMPL domain-containing protein [Caldicellulosiruptor naganoensis]
MKTKKLKAILMVIVLLFVSVFIFSLWRAEASSASASQPKTEINKTEINVKGVASVLAEPDIAVVTFGVLSEDVSADAAYSKTSSKINKIIDAIKKLGIDSKDIKTLKISVYPKYSYNKDDNASKIIGFYASTDLTVTVRNISQVGKVVDSAFKNGANTFSDLRFDISNVGAYYNQALAKALENAKEKANVLAKGLGISLGKPRIVNENTYINTPPIVYKTQEMALSASSSQIQGGTIEIKAEVTLTY